MLYRGDPGETFCLALAEAQAMGLPAVVKPLGSTPERVIDGVTGRVAEDDDGFAAAAVALLRDDNLWRRLAPRRARTAARAELGCRRCPVRGVDTWRAGKNNNRQSLTCLSPGIAGGFKRFAWAKARHFLRHLGLPFWAHFKSVICHPTPSEWFGDRFVLSLTLRCELGNFAVGGRRLLRDIRRPSARV